MTMKVSTTSFQRSEDSVRTCSEYIKFAVFISSICCNFTEPSERRTWRFFNAYRPRDDFSMRFVHVMNLDTEKRVFALSESDFWYPSAFFLRGTRTAIVKAGYNHNPSGRMYCGQTITVLVCFCFSRFCKLNEGTERLRDGTLIEENSSYFDKYRFIWATEDINLGNWTFMINLNVKVELTHRRSEFESLVRTILSTYNSLIYSGLSLLKWNLKVSKM